MSTAPHLRGILTSIVDAVEHDLAVRLQAGDATVARELYRAYGRLVFAVAHRVLENRTLAEDATQQAFLQAWSARARVDPARGLRSWLCTIAQRAAIDIHRRETRHRHDELDPERSTNESVEAWDVWRVREAVENLTEEERVVVRMQHFEGYTLAEISERLGLSIGTVKSRSFRAHRRLATALGTLEEVTSG
jgi:RNA polymerase sigma factor (sigma-70 family)